MLHDRHDLVSEEGGVLLDAIFPGRTWLPTGWCPQAVVERMGGSVARLLPPVSFDDPEWPRQLLTLDLREHGVLLALPEDGVSSVGPSALACLRELRFFRGPLVALQAAARSEPVGVRALKAVRRGRALALPLSTAQGVQPALYFRRQLSGVAPAPTARALRGRVHLGAGVEEKPGTVRLDPRVDNPIGWRQAPPQPPLRLLATDPLPRTLQRHSGVLLITQDAAPVRVAQQAARLAARGMPFVPDGMDNAWLGLLSPGLVDVLTAASPVLFDDADARERHSVALRRVALRDHAPSLGRPCVSVLLVTRRPEFLDHALHQVRKQTYEPRELILTLHEHGLADYAHRRVNECAVDNVTVREVEPDQPLGAAMAVATEAAQGDVVMKMDDDDWYSPSHVEDLVFGLLYSGALLAGRARDFFYVAELDRTVRLARRDVRFSRQIHGGAMAIRREHLLQVGGWATNARGLVDSRLLDAVEREGELVLRLGGLGLLVHRRPSGHTWSPDLGRFLRTPFAQWRGLALEQAGIND